MGSPPSALLAGHESIRRFFEPQPVANLPWVLIAGAIGFAGNELLAVYRIRVGRRIKSAALMADCARTDGFTSLAVVLAVIGIRHILSPAVRYGAGVIVS